VNLVEMLSRLAGDPDYGAIVTLSPWPDGGWMASVCVIDRDYLVEQRADVDQESERLFDGLMTLAESENFPAYDMIDGFGGLPTAFTAHGEGPEEAVRELYRKVVDASGWNVRPTA
jgi:predicted RNase H-like HicB family nuclease